MYTQYDEWEQKVDAQMVDTCGMGIDDLPDYDYRAAYNANKTPVQCAKKAIANAKECY